MVFTLRTAFVSACLLVRYTDLLFTFPLGGNKIQYVLHFVLHAYNFVTTKKHFSEQYLTKWLFMSEVLCLHCLFVVLAQLHCHWLRSALHLVPWIVLDVPDDTSILHIRHILHFHIYVSKLCATYVVAVITSPINGLQYSNYFLLN